MALWADVMTLNFDGSTFLVTSIHFGKTFIQQYAAEYAHSKTSATLFFISLFECQTKTTTQTIASAVELITKNTKLIILFRASFFHNVYIGKLNRAMNLAWI